MRQHGRVKHRRFQIAVMSCALILSGISAAFGQENHQPSDIDRMAEQAKQLGAQAGKNQDVMQVLEASGGKGAGLSDKEARSLTERAREMLRESRTFQGHEIGIGKAKTDKPAKRVKIEKKLYTGERTFLFISQSMGEKTLSSLIRHYAGRSDVVLVMRGMNRDQSFGKMFRLLYRLKQGIKNPPAVIMDSRLFDVFGIRSVPAMVRVSKGIASTPQEVAQREIARVEGLDHDDWLLEKIRSGERGDFGKKGPVREITELSLTELVKLRASQIDWEKKKREAYQRAWQNIKITPLTPASKTVIRTVSAEVVATADIKDSKGKIIIPKGTKANQLAVRPWRGAIVVFDPTSNKELDWVTAYRDDIEARFRPVKYIITNIDRDDGWRDYKRLSDRLDRHLYVLVPDLAARFQLEHTISIVHADNDKKVFLVSEIKP